MIEVVQAFDRTPIAQLDTDGAAALDRKIETGPNGTCWPAWLAAGGKNIGRQTH